MGAILALAAVLVSFGLVCAGILRAAGHPAGLDDAFTFAVILAIPIGIGVLGYNAIYP